jgi:hypothetical protein
MAQAKPIAARQQPKGQNSGTLEDPAATIADRAYGDARELSVACEGSLVKCVLTMATPLAEGMFTCIELRIDCDDKPNTGLGGDELLIRAAVGSRFQSSYSRPTNGQKKAIEHTRISGTRLVSDGQGGKSWLHMGVPAPPPVVLDRQLQFHFPLSLIRERGDRYHTRFVVKAVVQASNSDQPIESVHACSDEGLDIQVDGSAQDWTGKAAHDLPGELHRCASCIDLASLRVEHNADSLFLCAELGSDGFMTWQSDDDVQGQPWVTFFVEPLFPRYQTPVRISVPGGWNNDVKDPAGAYSYAIGGRCVEVRVRRQNGQGRFRLVTHSDLILTDEFSVPLRLEPDVQ